MLIGAGVAVVGSERVRKVVGKGIGYVAAGTMTVGRPVAHAAEDIYDEARHVAAHDGSTRAKPRAKSAAAAR
jgi:hypothetical protein